MEKRDTRRLKPEVQEELRKQAIRLRKNGMSYREIGEVLGVHPTSACTWYTTYLRDGLKAISMRKRGRRVGACRSLSAEQEKELRNLVIDKTPDQLKLPFALWTREAVKEVVRDRYGIEMPIRTVGEYLKRWGFTAKKPVKRAYEQNPKAVQRWLQEDYPGIAARAKSEGVNAEEVCLLFAGIICPLYVGIKCPLFAGLVKTRYPVQASPRQPWEEARTFPLCAFP